MPITSPKDENLYVYQRMMKSPKYFIQKMWGLEPQVRGFQFLRGKNWTWQQDEILSAVENAVNGIGPKRITVRSGRGIGKSCTLAWLVLWYLFTHKDAQVPCTAPTSEQMNDVLWKEIAKWISRMPKNAQRLYEWTNTHVRMTDNPNVWFARAKTARKETPEALAGIHGEYVFLVVDEASGVPDQIFTTAEGFLTDKNTLVLMFSNPTRLEGYFFDSFHKDKNNWINLHFSSIDSPIVDSEFVSRIISKYGEDSDEYRVQVLGDFPKDDLMDTSGYVPLLEEYDLHYTTNGQLSTPIVLGVDPSGEGENITSWVVRDNFKAKIIGKEQISSDKSIAGKTLTIMTDYGIAGDNVIIDNFGVGANVAKELALSREKVNSHGVNVGNEAIDKNKFTNLKAEAYWRLREWLRRGGELVNHTGWEELLSIKFKRELGGYGRIKIMSKKEMRNRGIPSPNYAEALMMTFVRGYINNPYKRERKPYKPRNPITGY